MRSSQPEQDMAEQANYFGPPTDSSGEHTDHPYDANGWSLRAGRYPKPRWLLIQESKGWPCSFCGYRVRDLAMHVRMGHREPERSLFVAALVGLMNGTAHSGANRTNEGGHGE